jgi:hypothetical protein
MISITKLLLLPSDTSDKARLTMATKFADLLKPPKGKLFLSVPIDGNKEYSFTVHYPILCILGEVTTC